MMRFGWKFNLCQTFVMFLLCTSLAGQNQTTKNQAPTEHSPKNVSTKNNNDTTSSENPWKLLGAEDKKRIAIATMSVSAVSGLLNFITIVAIVIDPLKILRKGPWITIFNLATADLISSVSFFCLWGDKFFVAIEQRKLYYAIFDFSWIFGAAGSFLWLTMFTVQIFALTKSPLKGRYWFTTKRMVLVGTVIWLCAFLLGLTNISWLHFSRSETLKFFIGQKGVLQIAVCIQIVLNIQVAVTIIRAGGSVENVENSKHQNIAKTVIILTLILFLTTFPYFILKQIEFLVRLGYFGQSKTSAVLNDLAYCYTPIATLNFLANPILYSLRLPDYRKTLLSFFGKENTRSFIKKSPMHISLTKTTKTSTARSQKPSRTSI